MTENQNPLVLDKNEEISEQKADDIRVQLRQDPEVQRISQQIDVKNQMELLEYGKEPAVEISKFSDRILNMMKTTSVTDSGTMLTQLGKIMDRFDKNDFDEPKGFLAKMFKRGNSMIEKIFQKYRTLGGEIEKSTSKFRNTKMKWQRRTIRLKRCMKTTLTTTWSLKNMLSPGR